MDIVGLYRLCGSATKKRILREAFERNPRLVDLSPDSVPDINVITGRFPANWFKPPLGYDFVQCSQRLNASAYPAFALPSHRAPEGVSTRAARAAFNEMPLSNASGRAGGLPARRPGGQCQAHVLHSGVFTERQSGTFTFTTHFNPDCIGQRRNSLETRHHSGSMFPSSINLTSRSATIHYTINSIVFKSYSSQKRTKSILKE